MTQVQLATVGMYNLLRAIRDAQQANGNSHPGPTLKQIKETLQGYYQKEYHVTFTSVMHARTEAITSGLISKEGYHYQLTSLGEKELGGLVEAIPKEENPTSNLATA